MIAKELAGSRETANCLGMKLVCILPGKFIMGSPASNLQRTEFEEEHEVEITQPF